MKLIILSLYAIVSLPILALSTCYYMENTRSHYDNYNDLKRVIEHGWLPAYFPTTSTDITEGHNIDSNRVWASFSFNISDIQKLKNVCKVIVENENGVKLLCPPYDTRTSTFILLFNGQGDYLSYENSI